MRTFGKHTYLAILLCMGIVMLAGCTTRLGDFTVLSSKNVDVSGLTPGDRYAGEDCANYLFMFIPLGEINWNNAMDKALEKGKGDVLVDIVLTQTGWMIPYLWMQQCIIIEGTVSQSASYRG